MSAPRDEDLSAPLKRGALLTLVVMIGCGGGGGSAADGASVPGDGGAPDAAPRACVDPPPEKGPWQPVRASGPNQLGNSRDTLVIAPGYSTLLAFDFPYLRLFRSHDVGQTWCHVPTPKDGLSATFAGPGDRTIYLSYYGEVPAPSVDAGADRPPAVPIRFLRSDDAGETWADRGGELPAGTRFQWLVPLGTSADDLIAVSDDYEPQTGRPRHVLWRSRDGGRAWERMPDAAIDGMRALTWPWIARHPRRPGQLYALASRPTPNPADPMGPLVATPALLVSSDEGAIWQMVSVPGGGFVQEAWFDADGRLSLLRGIADDPATQRGEIVVEEREGQWAMRGPIPGLATLQHRGSFANPPAMYVEGINVERTRYGMFRSSDEGRTWSMLPFTISGVHFARGSGSWLSLNLAGLRASEDDGQTWTWRHEGSGGTVAAVLPGGDLFVSSSSRTWHSRDQGRTSTNVALPMGALVQFLPDPRIGGSYYAVSRQMNLPGAEGQVLSRTADGGRTWARLPIEKVASVLVTPTDPPVLLASTVNGVMRSVDEGQTWTRTEARAASGSLMRFSPSDPRTIYLQDAPTGGSARSRDGGITWTSNPQVFHQGVVDLVADPLHPGIHYVVSQDRVVRYADGHDPKGLLVRPAGVGSVAVSPIQAGLIIVSEPAGSLAISQDLGDTWQHERSLPFGAALAFDGADPDLFYAVGLFGTIRRRFE